MSANRKMEEMGGVFIEKNGMWMTKYCLTAKNNIRGKNINCVSCPTQTPPHIDHIVSVSKYV